MTKKMTAQYKAIQKAITVLEELSDSQYDELVDEGCLPDTAKELLINIRTELSK